MDSVSIEVVQKLISDLKKQVEQAQTRAAMKHLHSLDPSEWITAQRAIGAERMLEDLARRLRSALGLRPEWLEAADPIREDIHLRPRIPPGRDTNMLGITDTKRRKTA